MSAIGQRDQTGLVYSGRHEDGRYVYDSRSVLGAPNRVYLTHEQRVGLAVFYKLARLLRPEVRTVVRPMVRERHYRGFGSYAIPEVWIQRPLLEEKNREEGARTLAHELAHTMQPRRSKPHGPEFREIQAALVVRLREVTRDFREWPAIDRRRLRDSKAPGQVRRERRRGAASKTKTQEWVEKLQRARAKVEEWKAKRARAESIQEQWERKLRHAERHLGRARERES